MKSGFSVVLVLVLVTCIYAYAVYLDHVGQRDGVWISSKRLISKDYSFVLDNVLQVKGPHVSSLFSQCYNVNGTIKTTWSRESIYQRKNIRLEYWKDDKEHDGNCSWPDGLTSYLVDTITRKKTTHIAFIGDSLTRNLANSFIDLLRPRSGFRMNPIVMINGHVHRSMIQYPLSRESHFHGWNDGIVSLEEYGIQIHMVWRPWYPPARMLDDACEDRFPTCFNHKRAEVLNHYVDPWLQRGALNLQKDIQSLPKDCILVFGYPVVSTKPRADGWMRMQLPKILSAHKDRAIFVSHLKDARVTALLEELRSLDVTFEWYGDTDTTPAELWYDDWHVWGPVQELASKNLLLLMSRLDVMAMQG